ncbi:amino acid permease-associated region [Isosphaera pallida ATCC 43644]|uniref:Amino acid permease-associated region n=1 Tax=Isosphaera pallida (strain ATCC 43644 / DSM 9630 / IS1B) TaxID=575540 RepID=E8QYE9_ISOPI|nr:amino acid permease [Isosphaera pallida]ADV64132.1 amino acid permease-associated region [Isosphaera pallida ATCC 43644]
MLHTLFRRKPLDQILAQADPETTGLKRNLSAWSITLLGVGAIIGAGIFGTIGTATAGDTARPGAGPSLMLSFVITAVVCGFTALCYAEFASVVPVSGSAYTYSYATLGELLAWILGWNLVIEYAIGNIAVAISWSSYFQALLANPSIGVALPDWLATTYRNADDNLIASAPKLLGWPIIFNAPAVGVVALITGVLVVGIRESARFNAVMVLVKILVLVFFIGAALWAVSPTTMVENWTPFQPNGWGGTLAAAAVVFFSYIGFDAVSTVAEETRRPARDLPLGIIGSLVICTIFYVLIAAVFTGIVPFGELLRWTDQERGEPLTKALAQVFPNLPWVNLVMATGAVISTTAVLLVFQLGQPRIFMAMARDGLLPKFLARVHPTFGTPHVTTILTGLFVAFFAAFASLDEVVDLTNIGTLFAFTLVCLGIVILRHTDPERPRAFKVPFGPYVLPLMGAVSCVFLAYYLPPASWWRFVGWLALGLAIYFGYGYSHSVLGRSLGRSPRTSWTARLVSIGFLAQALGLYTVPHDLGLAELIALIGDPALERAQTALVGATAILGGSALAIVGLVVEAQRRVAP